MRTLWTSLGRGLYGLYAWAVLLSIAGMVTLAVTVVPGLDRRRRLARTGARAVFRACAIPLTIEHPREWLEETCVVVANHASYLDGIILTAALPPRFSFVIKREVTSVPFMHFLLRRLGSEFVERFDRHKSATDARRILRKAGAGHSLAFFPEGSFQRQPGIARFRTGAFAAAVRAGVAVVPVNIHGSRAILPSGAALPRPGRLRVVVHEPVAARPEDRRALADLRDRCRAVILAESGEPDLAGQLGPV